MAQAAALLPNGAPSTMTAEELREILEYEKIVQFRDAIFAGTHPRIKIPPLAGKQIEAPRVTSSPNLSTSLQNSTTQLTRATSHNHQSALPYSNNRSPSNYRAVTSKSEINPIFLEKSDDLIRAEMQLQRQRLERSFREQMEQQKMGAKAQLHSSEALPNFDPTEVLSKALALVPPVPPAEAEPAGGARSPATDSFDENTFYSSRHDTPEPFSSPNGAKEPGEVQSNDVLSIDEQPAELLSAENGERQDVLSHNNHIASQLHSQVKQLPAQLTNQTRSAELQQSLEMTNSESSSSRGARVEGTSDVSSQQKEYIGVSTHQVDPLGLAANRVVHPVDQTDGQVSTEQLLQQAFANDTTSPLIRAHNLSPIAPQPARVSPLATARAPPIVQESRFPNEAPPAQVAALRQQPAGISSADSSPKGAKSSEKRKGKKEKKKKRKASVNDNATPDSPYIKPEPRSPSPFSVMPLPRPQKRQRQVGQFAAELNYDEPTGAEHERVPEPYERAPIPRARERLADNYDQGPRRVEPRYHRLERDDEDFRVGSGAYTRNPHTPTVYTVPYDQREAGPGRAASHSMVERRIYEEPIYYKEPIQRYSVRPDANRERSRSPAIRERRSPIPMAPPRPVRIVVDAYGREYIDPVPTSALRQSAAPPARYRDPEVIYERAPIRTVSSRGPVDAYEEGGVVYRRPSPPLVAPRRVITQPGYAIPEYRSYRQREYSVRPSTMAPPGEEFIQVRGPVERRQMSYFEEAPREYAPRPPSVHPEPVPYEVPREYVGRLQSTRPEPPPREYATSVHPEARREMPQREYSVRPEARHEMPIRSQREYSVRPVESIPRREQAVGPNPERYYEEVPRGRAAEIAFIERPRARESSVVVYADDVRREVVYR